MVKYFSACYDWHKTTRKKRQKSSGHLVSSSSPFRIVVEKKSFFTVRINYIRNHNRYTAQKPSNLNDIKLFTFFFSCNSNYNVARSSPNESQILLLKAYKNEKKIDKTKLWVVKIPVFIYLTCIKEHIFDCYPTNWCKTKKKTKWLQQKKDRES